MTLDHIDQFLLLSIGKEEPDEAQLIKDVMLLARLGNLKFSGTPGEVSHRLDRLERAGRIVRDAGVLRMQRTKEPQKGLW